MPAGMNKGSITEAMNRIEISGTPRMTSMKTMAMMRIAGSLEARASARTTPSGKPSARPTAVRMKESGRPLHSDVGTGRRPKTPPAISAIPRRHHAGPEQEQPAAPEPWDHGESDGSQEQRHRQGGAPMLLVGIDAEDHEPRLRGQEGKAGAVGRTADGGSSLRHRACDEPAPGRLGDKPEQHQAEDGDQCIERRAEQRLHHALEIAGPAGGLIAAISVWDKAQRSFSATRALYQFMKSEITIERVR